MKLSRRYAKTKSPTEADNGNFLSLYIIFGEFTQVVVLTCPVILYNDSHTAALFDTVGGYWSSLITFNKALNKDSMATTNTRTKTTDAI